MKKFFTNIPIQLPGGLENMVYEAVGNDRLTMSEKTRFPILSVVHGYAERGEPFRLIAVETKGGGGSENLKLLRQELDALCVKVLSVRTTWRRFPRRKANASPVISAHSSGLLT